MNQPTRQRAKPETVNPETINMAGEYWSTILAAAQPSPIVPDR